MPTRPAAMGGSGNRGLARTEAEGLPDTMPRRSTPPGAVEPGAADAACGGGGGPQRAGDRPRQRADRACRAARRRRTSISRAARLARSRPDGAHRRPRHARGRAARAALAAGLAAPLATPVAGVRIRAAALLAAVPIAQPAGRRSRALRAAPRPSSSPRSASTPTGRRAARRWASFYRPARPGRRGRGGVQGGAETQPAICAGGGQSRRSLPPARPRGEGESVLRAALASSPQRRRAPPCARADADPH